MPILYIRSVSRCQAPSCSEKAALRNDAGFAVWIIRVHGADARGRLAGSHQGW